MRLARVYEFWGWQAILTAIIWVTWHFCYTLFSHIHIHNFY